MAKAKAVKKPRTKKFKSEFPNPLPATKSLPKKGDISIRLACGCPLKTTERPNPRKVWPDSQMCELHKKKARVIEIHTQLIKENS